MRISDWSSDVCSSDLVSVRPEIAAGPRVVAADDVALHPRDRELEGLGDLRHEPPPDPCLGGRTDLRLLDHVILPPLVAVVDDEHGPAPVVADEARLLSPLRLVQADQVPAELGLEDAGYDQEDRKSTRLNSSH